MYSAVAMSRIVGNLAIYVSVSTAPEASLSFLAYTGQGFTPICSFTENFIQVMLTKIEL